VTGADVARVRKQRGWSQQQLSVAAGVNRPYISEYEAGIRPVLPERMLAAITAALLADPAGRAGPELVRDDEGRLRLKLHTASGEEFFPDDASVQWTESDGSTYSFFVGRVD